jgi:hypothetical protein
MNVEDMCGIFEKGLTDEEAINEAESKGSGDGFGDGDGDGDGKG